MFSWGYGLLGNSSEASISTSPQKVTYFDEIGELVESIACGLDFCVALTGSFCLNGDRLLSAS